MLKKILLSLLFLGVMAFPAFAGVYEDALKNNKKVFLYLYVDKCKYCSNFEPIYKKVSSTYGKQCKFLKVNADTKEGYHLMKLFGARYVPFVIIADSDLQEISQIEPNCLLNFKCTNYFVDRFIRR